MNRRNFLLVLLSLVLMPFEKLFSKIKENDEIKLDDDIWKLYTCENGCCVRVTQGCEQPEEFYEVRQTGRLGKLFIHRYGSISDKSRYCFAHYVPTPKYVPPLLIHNCGRPGDKFYTYIWKNGRKVPYIYKFQSKDKIKVELVGTRRGTNLALGDYKGVIGYSKK